MKHLLGDNETHVQWITTSDLLSPNPFVRLESIDTFTLYPLPFTLYMLLYYYGTLNPTNQ